MSDQNPKPPVPPLPPLPDLTLPEMGEPPPPRPLGEKLPDPKRKEEPRKGVPPFGIVHWLVLTVFLAAFAWFYIVLAERLITTTNGDPLASDQKHNMKLALGARDLRAGVNLEGQGVAEAVKQWVPHYTDGVVNPLWPWVSSWVAPAGMNPSVDDAVLPIDEVFFLRGKWLNVTLTGLFVLLLGFSLAKRFTILGTVNCIVLVGLGAFLPRSVYFQPEPLYYIFFFLAWATAAAILRKNTIWLYTALGVASGLAYLAKASVLPLLGIFLAVSTLRFFAKLFGIGSAERKHADQWSCAAHFLGILFLSTGFFLTAGPRLEFAAKTYGDPLHTYPGYWMWMDNFEEGFQWMNEHPDRRRLEGIIGSDIPSFETYRKTHSDEEVVDRAWDGTSYVVSRFFDPPRRVQKKDEARPWNHILHYRGYYLGALAGILLLTGVAYSFHREDPDFPSHRIAPGSLSVGLFVVGTFAAYAVLYGWYVPIGKGDRFLLSLYAPLVFSLIAASENIIRRVRLRREHLWITWFYQGLQVLLTAALVYRVLEIWGSPVFAA